MRIADLSSVAAQIEHEIANGPIVPDVTPEQIRDHLAARYDFTTAMAPAEVIDDGDEGLRSLPAAPTIYLTREAHDSFHKIAHMTGLGRQALRPVATDRDLTMDLADLARCVAEDRRHGLAPVMVVGTVGTTAAGAID